jgi:uncharacterized protein YdhG (YjbR/CyaY superfamily)
MRPFIRFPPFSFDVRQDDIVLVARILCEDTQDGKIAAIFEMAMKKKIPKDIDDYIDRCPKEAQHLLTRMRETIQRAAPEARETISYRMPAFTLNGILVWFAAHKSHIGFYPHASGISAFKKELSAYKQAKGSVQFPFDKPLPLALVGRIVKFRVKENLAKGKKK